MTTELVKILETIVQAINNNFSFEDVEKFIKIDNKFNKTTVAAAYSWIYEKRLRELYRKKELQPKPSESLRILSNDEVTAIGLQNYNYILHFYNIGMLNNNDFELIIDHVKMFPDDERNTDNINLLILSVFLDLEKISTPGSRYMLYSSDTIN
ncbi:MAG: DUF494 domain-containing protein [Bacteroidetes bacterium]|nr:DUF494 domain-containing protein [Bacteroidota bacterium]